MTRAADLERIIRRLDTLAEKGEPCINPDTGEEVSDNEYDMLRLELLELKPNSKIFDTVTASEVEDEEVTDDVEHTSKKVRHNPPMTSIEKASHQDRDVQEGMLFDWINRVTEETASSSWTLIPKTHNGEDVLYPAGFFAMSYKLDGAAVAINYEKGILVSAGLRPRAGKDGEDVTEQIQYVTGVPKKLKLPVTCSIRGELICKVSDFNEVQKYLDSIGEKKRANPRNHAAGGIRQFKHPEKVEHMRLTFTAYTVENLKNPPYKTEIERAKWVEKELGIPFVKTREFDFEELQMLENNIRNLDYKVDGAVISVNDLETQEQLGRHGDKPTGNPRGKLAWKFAEERAKVAVNDVEWNTNRTGTIRPVAIFNAVRLAETEVGRATLHNYGFMKRHGIGIGTTIEILKAGSIIPKVVGVVKDKISGEPPYPKQCPSCMQKTKLVEGGKKDGVTMWDLVCDNEDCPARSVNVFCHFLKTIGILGLGESKVELLLQSGKIRNFADLFRISVEDITELGTTPRVAMLAVADLHMIANSTKYEDDQLFKKIISAMKKRKKIPMSTLFAAFGIKSAGDSAGKELAEHFRDFDKLRNASVEELVEVEGVGQKTAELIHEYFHKNEGDIDHLMKYVEVELPKTGKLTGMIFCFSGSFDEGKKHWEEITANLGGKTSDSVSQKTTYLVAGPGSVGKSEKAKKYGIPIIGIDEFQKML